MIGRLYLFESMNYGRLIKEKMLEKYAKYNPLPAISMSQTLMRKLSDNLKNESKNKEI
ncbi:MAG: hypothetical protein K6B67_08680 [Lachnospiraceae bacterium]|nr:hypothetical protein [Lachnospiraceae bacterium]